MAAAAPTVAKSPPVLVPPAGPTPGGVLPLSSIDKTAAVRVSVDFIQVFPPSSSDGAAGDQVAAMREGFAKALVPYYPVAGRIAEPSPGDLVVDCTGEGVWFVDAAASCSLADVNGLERPLLIPKTELIPRPPPEEKLEDLILMAQVTKFTCGGFAVGICFSHLVFDGQGAAQFLKAAGELARGLPAPSVAPVWDREAIPDPPKLPRGPPPSFTAFSFVTQVVEISPENIARIKDDFKAATGGQTCSTFDAVTAVIFKCRALAVELPDDAEVRLGFAASTRHLLQGVLPSVDGYYGNCVYPVGITRSLSFPFPSLRHDPPREILQINPPRATLPPTTMAEVADASRRATAGASNSPPPSASGGSGDRKRGRSSPVLPPPPPGAPPPGAQNKRQRPEGGGFDRRRLGGGGQDDRRFGNDHGGQGRHSNRGPDWHDSGRGGWNEGSGNSRREGLMSYKQFMQELEDDVSPVEAQRRYEEYKSEYITTQKKAYFDLHKNDDWLRNKYHPTNLESVMERRNELARATANEFFQDLQSGSLDVGPGLTSSAAHKSGNNDVNANGKKGKFGKGPDDLYYSAPKAHPVSSEPRRISIDIDQAQALICKLDSEKGVENNVLSSSDDDKADRGSHGSMGPIVIIRGASTVKGLEGVELLDTLVTYLWRIHGVDYYGMSETNEPKGLRHVKADSRTYDGASSNTAEWEEKLDSFWQDRIQGQDPLEILKAKEKIDVAASEVLDPYVRKIRDEKYGWKYGCGAKGCTKLFHASEFVTKHLKLKHTDFVVELTSKVREDIYFENYMNDPKAPGGTPIMQQSAPREKGRHRPPIESRLRDERGQRFDKNVDSSNHDGSSENPDDPMYDSYGDPAVNGDFPADAPPMLVPVPGAGPLGPFIPAPPEVAMRMLREQGGPPPFEPAAGPRPRKAGRGGGPPMGGPSPMLNAPFPPMHDPRMQDPRKIRSYQDLDAPGDEVTVLDYRSL